MLSVTILAVLYGTAVGRWHWPPFSVLEGAVAEAKMILDPRGPLLNSRDYERHGTRLEQPDRMQPGPTFVAYS